MARHPGHIEPPSPNGIAVHGSSCEDHLVPGAGRNGAASWSARDEQAGGRPEELLPFVGGSFDAAWSVRTLMHLPGRGFDKAISELGRGNRPRGLLAIGVWGHPSSRVWTKEDGRCSRHPSDAELRQALRVLGDVIGFETWDWHEDGGHYRFARVLVR